jgi:hypothetical protein
MNRQTERDELKKWAIKMMRAPKEFEFDAIVGAGEAEMKLQEVDPGAADEQAPVVRFFESAFEWQHMSYFAYPYFWGRRGAWHMRQRIQVPNDPRHEAFLKAGFVRAVVPILPGFESRVMQYLSDNSRIPTMDEEEGGSAPLESESLWMDLMVDRGRAVAMGNARLKLELGETKAEVLNGSATPPPGGSTIEAWKPDTIDIGRRIFVRAQEYLIASVAPGGMEFELDRPFEGVDGVYSFLAGSVPFGEPWEVRVPTRLVFLGKGPEGLS